MVILTRGTDQEFKTRLYLAYIMTGRHFKNSWDNISNVPFLPLIGIAITEILIMFVSLTHIRLQHKRETILYTLTVYHSEIIYAAGGEAQILSILFL